MISFGSHPDAALQVRVERLARVPVTTAMDLLKGISLYTRRNPILEKRPPAKSDKVAANTK